MRENDLITAFREPNISVSMNAPWNQK